MNEYTQRVVALARASSQDPGSIQSEAASGLADFLLERSGRPRFLVHLESMAKGHRVVHAIVRKVWAAEPKSRWHICLLAALHQLAHELDGQWKWDRVTRVILAVGDDMNIWESWPELHDVDVKELFPYALEQQQPQPKLRVNPNQIISSHIWDGWKITGPR